MSNHQTDSDHHQKHSAKEVPKIPEIMVFRPTLEEMKDFSKYIEYMESKGAHKAGLAKIIPPKTWTPRKSGYDDIITSTEMKIKDPIEQEVHGRDGIYQVYNIERKTLSVSKFRKLAESNKYSTAVHSDYDELERKYWRNIKYLPPIYGADVGGSLYDEDCKEFNIRNLGTCLDLVNQEYDIQIQGVNTPYLYFGEYLVNKF